MLLCLQCSADKNEMKLKFQVHKRIEVLAVLTAICSLPSSAWSAPITLDNFDTVVFGVDTLGPTTSGPMNISIDSDIPSILRTANITPTGGTGSSSSGNLLGVLVYDNGALAQSKLTFNYDFPSFDLATTGASYFGFFVIHTEMGKDTDYSLTITSPDGSATGTGTLPSVVGLASISLAGLNVAGTPFNDATSIVFELTPKIAGTDLVIDAYGFGFDIPASAIPESSTYAATGCALILAGSTLFRRARRV